MSKNKKDFKSEYGMFDFVYLITDTEQFRRQIIEIRFIGNTHAVYMVALGDLVTPHSDGELSKDRDNSVKFN